MGHLNRVFSVLNATPFSREEYARMRIRTATPNDNNKALLFQLATTKKNTTTTKKKVLVVSTLTPRIHQRVFRTARVYTHRKCSDFYTGGFEKTRAGE
jgi:hypothetical protein